MSIRKVSVGMRHHDMNVPMVVWLPDIHTFGMGVQGAWSMALVPEVTIASSGTRS